MLKIAICDDSPIFLEHAIEFIRNWSEESRIPAAISSYTNGDDLLSAIAAQRMDIIFLDIIMPLFNGMDTAREIRKTDKTTQIIFLTSSPEFALESYEVKAQGYLLKPVTYERIKDTLDDCAQMFREEPEPFHSFENRFTVEDGFFKCHRSYLVYLQNVDHFSTSEITMKSGQIIPISRNYSKAFKEAYFAQMFQDS